MTETAETWFNFQTEPIYSQFSDKHLWLNLNLYLGIPLEDGRLGGVGLTPKQTYWVCRQLADNSLLRAEISSLGQAEVARVRASAELIQQQVECGNLFLDNDAHNKLFSTALEECDKNLYTR